MPSEGAREHRDAHFADLLLRLEAHPGDVLQNEVLLRSVFAREAMDEYFAEYGEIEEGGGKNRVLSDESGEVDDANNFGGLPAFRNVMMSE